MRVWATIRDAVLSHGRCAMVTVARIEGSAPRESGARLVVLPGGGFSGSIGGGALEWQALADAEKMLAGCSPAAAWSRHALGPELGQCCGGSVRLLTESFDESCLDELNWFADREALGPFCTIGRMEDGRIMREQRVLTEDMQAAVEVEGPAGLLERFGEMQRQVLLFGAGHVGRALVLALAALPYRVTWIDSRRDAFPSVAPANVDMVHSENPAGELAGAEDAAHVIVMTHSHALDLEIVHQGLAADRFAYVGVIGSATKRTRFIRRLRDAGLTDAKVDKLICPVGVAGVEAKYPAAIAAAVAAELLIVDAQVQGEMQKPLVRLAARRSNV